jgi:integrase
MLTDTAIKRAAPREKDYKLADEKGLYLLVRPSGSRLWRHKYRVAGKERTSSYGPYPEVSLRQARDQRDATREILRAGRDPAIEARKAAASALTSTSHTFETLAREWHELQRERWAPIHAADVLGSMERDVFPTLGEFPPHEITAPLILACLRPVEKRGAVETASRLRQRIGSVLAYGLSLGIVPGNPAEQVKGALKPLVRRKRQPAITDLDQLRALLHKIESGGAYPVTLLASRFLALTAQRPGAIRRARWEDMRGIDSDAPVWHIPAEQMKLTVERKGDDAFDHVVPLSAAAVEVLRAVRKLSGRGALVFPGQRHAHRPLSENAIGYLYNRAGYHSRHVPHGWRAAFSTVMNERRPADRQVIDMMLAHVQGDKVEAAYNRAEHMARRRDVAEEWAGLVMQGQRAAEDLLTVARRKSLSADVR